MRVNGDIKPTEPPLFDAELIRRYDVNGPRYTSYPTALQFRGDFDADAYLVCAQESNGDPIPTPLSLYMHIPFCATVCFYCACNKVVTRNRRHAAEYLHHLFLEMEMQARLFDADRTVEQLHLGGGTPTFLDADQLAHDALMEHESYTNHFKSVCELVKAELEKLEALLS